MCQQARELSQRKCIKLIGFRQPSSSVRPKGTHEEMLGDSVHIWCFIHSPEILTDTSHPTRLWKWQSPGPCCLWPPWGGLCTWTWRLRCTCYTRRWRQRLLELFNITFYFFIFTQVSLELKMYLGKAFRRLCSCLAWNCFNIW